MLDWPVIVEEGKNLIKRKISNVISDTINLVDDNVRSKINLDTGSFNLEVDFDPSKVVNMEDIKKLTLSNLALYKTLLNCDDPITEVNWLCGNIDTLISDLSSKKLTVNDIYKLMLYQSTISKALYYNGLMDKYRSAAVVMWIDKANNMLKSIDIVRTYTQYDINENDVLPIVAKNIKIDFVDTVPQLNSNIKVVLWLRGGTVVGIRVAPVDPNLFIPWAVKYKVMEIEGYNVCDNNIWNNDYDMSLYYGIGKIWIWNEARWDNLEPANTKWIKFIFEKKCYKVFDNTK